MSQLDDVLELVIEVLGREAILGAYPHGSAVLGQLRPHSDLDVLVVLARPTTEAERRAITDGLLGISGRGRRVPEDRSVELTMVVLDEVRPWRYPPMSEYQYGDWLRAEYERGETPGPMESPDLAPLLTMVLLGGQSVVGPPPADLLDAVPADDLRRAVVAGIPGLVADLDGDEANVLLTFARIWTTLATGEIRAKDAAADWALERLPARHRPILERARDVYLGTADDDLSERRSDVSLTVAWIEQHVREMEGGE